MLTARTIDASRRFLLLTVLFSGALSAATLPLTVTPGLNSMDWTLSNTGGTSSGTAFAGSCDGSPGMSISEATSADGATDAYDNAWQLFIDDVIFVAPASVDLTGELFTAGPVTLSGLDTTVEIKFPGALQAARIRAIFSNLTASPITVDVDVPINLGSDSFTMVELTSDGDDFFSTADRWIITSDSNITTEPVVTSVLYGPGAPVAGPTSVTRTVCNDGLDTAGVGFSFTITIPANSRRSLMFFAGLGDIQGTNNTIAGALTNVTMFDSNTSIDTALLSDLTNGVLLQILNWDFAATTTTTTTDEDKNFIDDFIGCSLGSRKTSDPVMPLLALLAIIGLLRTRLNRRRN